MSVVDYTTKILAMCRHGLQRNIARRLYRNHSTVRRGMEKDWNTIEEFFSFSRGRFVFNAAENMSMRRVSFDMNELARVAANAIGANKCTNIEKCPDGMYNKSYVFTMDDGRQVIGKVPNPNAGVPHLTTASEVATLDFMRNELDTPVPLVHAYSNSREANAIGAEYIVMEKVQGVPLQQVWSQMKLKEKLDVVIQVFRFQKQWLGARFTTIGCLYYAQDLEPDTRHPCSFTDDDGYHITKERFALGPLVGREWADQGRSALDCDRGPHFSVSEYYKAILQREAKATRKAPHLPKQMLMICGPGLYQPTREKKQAALESTERVVDYVLPVDESIRASYLWHNDLHAENIFVNPDKPTNILGVIDWQSVEVAPLFEQSIDPGILDYDGPGIESLEKPELPSNYVELSKEEQTVQLQLLNSRALLVAYRRLIQKQAPSLYATIEFQASSAYDILRLSRRILDVGEAHLQCLVAELQVEENWKSLPGVQAAGEPSCPLHFSREELQRIEEDAEAADLAIQAMSSIRQRMGDLWPDKGAAPHDSYNRIKKILKVEKEELLKDFAFDPADEKIFNECWPFEE